MRFAIALKCGLYWNGFTFGTLTEEAATFARRDWAEKAMERIFNLRELPEDPEDGQFRANLYIQELPLVPAVPIMP